MLDDQFFRHHIARPELDHQMAATAATGTGGKFGMGGDGLEDDSLAGDWRPLYHSVQISEVYPKTAELA